VLVCCGIFGDRCRDDPVGRAARQGDAPAMRVTSVRKTPLTKGHAHDGNECG
jgi:hypothetical protein